TALKTALIIPVLNAEEYIPALFSAIFQQSYLPQQVLVLDSESTDRTRELLAPYPVQVHSIQRKDFDHGGTRRLATEMVDADIYLFMTQDAIPANPDSFRHLVAALSSGPKVGCAYGRQLPKQDADVLGAYDRLFNYPDQSQLRFYTDKDEYGIKTCFLSNSFAAYKKEALQAVGGFPSKLISSEDTYVAAKMLLKGYGVSYVAESQVYHSHNMRLKEKFHRYFSIGVFHGKENWLVQAFSGASSEGLRYLRTQLKYLIKNNKLNWLPYAILSTGASYFSYQLGLRERFIPLMLKKKWGVNKKYWLGPS
ncbi:MAG TPA: glycosyltransferase family A protein, partial [Gammaproteobacteria bacterium]|nr:glycosyltransferase family A protein [Gammaproteobacteria bacterium]